MVEGGSYELLLEFEMTVHGPVLDDVEYSFTGGVDGGRGWKGDVKFMRLDIKALMKHGWTPQYTSRRAIKETAIWLHKNSE